MKNYISIAFVLFVALVFSCKSRTKPVIRESTVVKTQSSDTIRIANNALKYEIIIIDGGFNYWLNSTAKPRGLYSQTHLESRNIPWVLEWNNRARSPKNNRESDLFSMQIDYQNGIDYGYEVNYLLYNYLTYFQLKNKIRLGGFTPRP